MKQRTLRAAGLALSVMAGGLALIGEASAHDSHGGKPMTEPGYEWGGHGMMPPWAGMWHGQGSCAPLIYGPCQSPTDTGWYHHQHQQQRHGQHHRQHMGPDMMGQGHMAPPDRPMPEGMMGPMMGPGARTMPGGAFHMGEPLASDLTIEQVKHVLGHRLAWLGLDRLKVGEVNERDQDVIIAEVVTEDGSLVQRLEVDRHTGWSRPVE
jgi:hypothetical protein